jgi:hypothetical protein
MKMAIEVMQESAQKAVQKAVQKARLENQALNYLLDLPPKDSTEGPAPWGIHQRSNLEIQPGDPLHAG